MPVSTLNIDFTLPQRERQDRERDKVKVKIKGKIKDTVEAKVKDRDDTVSEKQIKDTCKVRDTNKEKTLREKQSQRHKSVSTPKHRLDLVTTLKTKRKSERPDQTTTKTKTTLVFKVKIDIRPFAAKSKTGNDKDTDRIKDSRAEEKGPYTPSRVQAVPDKIPTESRTDKTR